MSYISTPMVPGPVSLHPNVLNAMSKDYPSGQIDDAFLPLYAQTGDALRRLMQSRHDVVLMTGEGMLALWGALKSTLRAGDRVLSVGTGVFGDGIGDMAASIGCEVCKISLPYDETIGNLDAIEEAIARFKPKMLTAVHCETPSGTLNPLAELGALRRAMDVPLFYVDAVASLGGAPVDVDGWGVDLLLGGSQKCLSAPPSMSIVGVSDVAWDCMEEVGYAGYDAIAPFRTVQADGRCPYTPYWHGVAALYAATQAIEEEGVEAVFARHAAVAKQCRDGLAELGISLWTAPDAVNSPTVTAAMIPNGIDWPTWRDALLQRGLAVAGSFGPMAGRVFRLGHMGTQANAEQMRVALECIADALTALRFEHR